jgi:hypothetical protein
MKHERSETRVEAEELAGTGEQEGSAMEARVEVVTVIQIEPPM